MTKAERLEIRASDSDCRLIDTAAKRLGVSRSELIREVSTAYAVAVLRVEADQS